MKLLACHIDNFGKLCDVNLQFSDGLNVINESNAWGKSTLAAFLKAMFYGLDAKKNAGAFDKERVMYRPWQGGAFGGEVDFEIDGKRYRISRTFGRTEKADEFHLYDLRTNLESYDYSEEIGNEIFELDSASFKRSIYIAQNDCASETSDGINAKLGNLAENTNDINNFESANQQLKEILNQLTPDRVTGSIKKRKSYITQLTQELRSFEAAQDGLAGIKAKEQKVTEQLQELLTVRKQYADALVVASEDSRRKTLHAQYEALCKEVEEKEKKKDEYKALFPVGVPVEAEFQTQMRNVGKMNEMLATSRSYELSIEEMENYGRYQQMFDEKVPTEADIDAVLHILAENDKEKEEIARQQQEVAGYDALLEQEHIEPHFRGSIAYRVILLIGIGVALVALFCLLAWRMELMPQINSSYLLIGALVTGVSGLILGIMGTVISVRVYRERQTWKAMIEAERNRTEAKKRVLLGTIAAIQEDVRKAHTTIGNFLGSYHVYCEVSDYQAKLYELKNQVLKYQQMKEKFDAGAKESAMYKEYRSKLLSFAKLYQLDLGKDEAYTLSLLQTKAAEYQMAEAAYQESYQKKEGFELAQEKSFWTKQALCPYSLDELNTWIAKTDERIEAIKAAKLQYSKQLEELQEQLDLRDEKQAELTELCVAQEKDAQKYHVLKLTQEYLQQAKEQFTARYMQPIANGFGKYYSLLTGDDSEKWMIDANIQLRIKEQGELREPHWFSAGYQDLIGVCMRLALVDAMYQDEKPFLILDDPFVNLDQEKVEAGNELLREVAEEYQVIYFTCHDSRSPM